MSGTTVASTVGTPARACMTPAVRMRSVAGGVLSSYFELSPAVSRTRLPFSTVSICDVCARGRGARVSGRL